MNLLLLTRVQDARKVFMKILQQMCLKLKTPFYKGDATPTIVKPKLDAFRVNCN